MADGQVRMVVVGSIGLDTVETPTERRADVIGGSASYACAAASFFAPVGMVGVVGDDFPGRYTDLYRRFGIDLGGLRRIAGKTFRWSGVYARDMNERLTLSTELNVFAAFSPEIPAAYAGSPFLFLANISPHLQSRVLEQMTAPAFVAADTMDLWIETERQTLLDVVRRVDLLSLNDSEIRQLTGENNLLAAARMVLDLGPAYTIVKKGEHGAMLFSAGGIFVLPAYPLAAFADPTGAGDTFAGGLIGALAASDGSGTDERSLRRAMLYGTVMASFGVERFGLDGLAGIDRAAIENRLSHFRAMLGPD